MSLSENPMVGIVMGSAADQGIMSKAEKLLREFGIPTEITVASAHRTPERVREYALSARDRGLQVIIAGAGWAAHLAGAIAGWTDLPVVAVPISSSVFQGFDALLASVMMPTGVPVAVMAVDGAENAAIFCAQILAVKYEEIRERVADYRNNQARQAVFKAAM